MTIDAAQLVPWVEMTEIEMVIEYSELQSLEYQLNKCEGQIIEQKFGDKVKVCVLLPLSEKKQLKQLFVHY